MVKQMDNQYGNQYGNQMNNGGQQMYQQPMYQQPMRPFSPMKTDRGMLKFILLNIITCGIYSLVFYSSLGEDLNLVARPRDGKNTMHFCLMYFIVGPLTCEIYSIIWFHNLSARIGNEARARGISTGFGAGSFWLWNVLGSLILVGPFIYLYQLCSTMNMICEDYNRNGF